MTDPRSLREAVREIEALNRFDWFHADPRRGIVGRLVEDTNGQFILRSDVLALLASLPEPEARVCPECGHVVTALKVTDVWPEPEAMVREFAAHLIATMEREYDTGVHGPLWASMTQDILDEWLAARAQRPPEGTL